MELKLNKPILSLRKPTLELNKKPAESPIKIQDGKYVRKRLATGKMHDMARKIL